MTRLVPMLILAALAGATWGLALPAAAQGGSCESAITLIGRDDLNWHVEGVSGVNPRLTACPDTDVTFTITVPEEETTPHNFAVQADGAPDTTDLLNPGDSVDYVWSTPASGSFTYICEIHPQTMKGTVVVSESAQDGNGGGNGGGSPDESGENGTPGLGVIALLGAVATVAVVARARRN